MAEAVQVEGLAQLHRALGRMDKTMRTELQHELREAAEGVAETARAIAEQKGLRRSGDHISGIRAFHKGAVVGVRAGATHRGFSYGKRLEYEGRGGSEVGPRASLLPALDVRRDDVVRRVEHVLDRVEDIFERRSI